MTLTATGQQLWEDGYSDFLAGGGVTGPVA